ncbi:hypothetical protein [Thermomonas sp.]|uniref:hypothetical protein n=1 Tax=Thermomonas sp. TaxID=1971895 RepID=UPI0026342165|nr:hypothetical protein [Thermomonas sp.]MCO5055588.1 hypothetical protein [Thermomonas sp.]HRO63388.1 hypothetical protein [Thermomonas sp.]
MSNTAHTTAIALTLALAGIGGAMAQSSTPPPKKIYCWDEGGRRVCGDALPASAANSARTEFNARTGLETGSVGRALTADERAAAAAAARNAQIQADAEAAARRRDLAMVESYRTEDDLRKAYGERTSLLDETIKSSVLGLSNLRLSLISLLNQASDKELASAPVPVSLTNSIRDQHAELLRQQQILQSQRADRAALEAEMQDSLRRYRETRQESAAGADAAPATPAPAAPATR